MLEELSAFCDFIGIYGRILGLKIVEMEYLTIYHKGKYLLIYLILASINKLKSNSENKSFFI